MDGVGWGMSMQLQYAAMSVCCSDSRAVSAGRRLPPGWSPSLLSPSSDSPTELRARPLLPRLLRRWSHPRHLLHSHDAGGQSEDKLFLVGLDALGCT